MIEFKLNGKPLSIPTAWEEATYNQYLQTWDLKGDYLQLVSIASGLDYEILKTAKIEGLESVIMAAGFLRTVPDFTGTCDKVGPYDLPKNHKGEFNIQFESLAQLEDMRAIMNTCIIPEQNKYDIRKLTNAYPSFVAIYLQKIRDTDYSYSKAIEMVPEVMDMPAKEVIITGSFFYVKLRSLLSGTLKTSPPTTLSPKKKKPVSAGSRKSSGRH